jgi:hypothetical protein
MFNRGIGLIPLPKMSQGGLAVSWLLLGAVGITMIAVAIVGRRLPAFRAGSVSPAVAAAGSVALIVAGLAMFVSGVRGRLQEPTDCPGGSCPTAIGGPLPLPAVVSPRDDNEAGTSDFTGPATLPTADPTDANPITGPADGKDAPTSTPTGDPPGRSPIVVPNLRGLSRADAVGKLASLALRSRVEERQASAVRGQVIDTKPPAGATVAPGTRVTLFVSNGVVGKGDLAVQENNGADLDEGAEITAPGDGGDIWFQADDQLSRFIAPKNSAQIASLGAARPSYEVCARARLRAAPIPFDELSAGIVLCVRTNEGMLSVVRLTQLPTPVPTPSPSLGTGSAVLKLTFTTYRDRE